ncbi:hypothetical protein [Caulobacter zeae]|uniref:hypothetical protein n=1 Tax=Caulobacter zeae TaxID=2055137 RepID=UPI001055EE8F|nr:hypothetical protein [Caulobacter zeae]
MSWRDAWAAGRVPRRVNRVARTSAHKIVDDLKNYASTFWLCRKSTFAIANLLAIAASWRQGGGLARIPGCIGLDAGAYNRNHQFRRIS